MDRFVHRRPGGLGADVEIRRARVQAGDLDDLVHQPQPLVAAEIQVRTASVAVERSELENLAWPRLFGNANPIELEIGIGKAGFLLRRAQALPQRNFFGIGEGVHPSTLAHIPESAYRPRAAAPVGMAASTVVSRMTG